MNSTTELALRAATDGNASESLLSLGLETLAVVIALGIVALLCTRRLGRTQGSGQRRAVIEPIDTRALGPKRSIHLLRVGPSYVLVGASEAGLQCLAGAELDASALDALTQHADSVAPPAPRVPFLQRLMQRSSRHELPAPR